MSQCDVVHMFGPVGTELTQAFGELINNLSIHPFHHPLRLGSINDRGALLDTHDLCGGLDEFVAEFCTVVAR